MLSSLTLNNFALFKKQSIDFENGFNCLLGQSGAGKSIVIDALSFVLGNKASKNLIRTGENSLRVDAVFCDVSNDVLAVLREQDIDFDDELIITRTLSADGKSSCKLNGFPVSLKILQTLAAFLVDFCGQHDSVGLLNNGNHLNILDGYCGENVEKQKSVVASLYGRLKDINKEISSLGGDESERQRTIELLQYQIAELEEANLSLGEDDILKERLDFISSSEKIFEGVSGAYEKLDGGKDAALSLLYDAKTNLSGLSNFKDVEECKSRLENVYYEIEDIAQTLKDIKSSTDFDERELDRIEDRLSVIKKLSRKYGRTIEDMLKFLDESKEKLEKLENSGFLLEKLETEKLATEKELSKQSEILSGIRKESALKLEKQVMNELEDLEMKGTFFKVDFKKGDFSAKGFDEVKFMFSANMGQEIKDLSKTASGGELSRLMLAFKNIMLGKEGVQTVVFDEIDAGISGVTAGKVAQKISNISNYIQVLCITHTPVVASKAKAFVLIEKKIVDNSTISTAKILDEDESVFEIARLIDGGKEVSQTAVEHAKKLISK